MALASGLGKVAVAEFHRMIEEARKLSNELLSQQGPEFAREKALVGTKLDEAQLWFDKAAYKD